VGTILLGGALGLLGTYALRDFLHVALTKDAAFQEAMKLSNGKGIINIGCGPHRTYQSYIIAEQSDVLANIDITRNGMPHFQQLDIEAEVLPFADKQFGVAFLSHILEHLDNWQFALAEASRVADYLVIVLPHPAYFSGWLAPGHRQHFSRDDMYEMTQLYPNVVVFY